MTNLYIKKRNKQRRSINHHTQIYKQNIKQKKENTTQVKMKLNVT
jgi:hypothetical protein